MLIVEEREDIIVILPNVSSRRQHEFKVQLTDNHSVWKKTKEFQN